MTVQQGRHTKPVDCFYNSITPHLSGELNFMLVNTKAVTPNSYLGAVGHFLLFSLYTLAERVWPPVASMEEGRDLLFLPTLGCDSIR